MPVDPVILAALTTPDEVAVGGRKVEFDDGMPTREGADLAYAAMDSAAAFDAFVQGLPPVSLWAIHKGFVGAGIHDGDVVLTSRLLDSRSLFLTANCDTVYFIAFLDLSDGPVLVDVPPDVLGAADDMWWRWITDFGVPGPDRGAGGRYLFTGPGYEGTLPEGGVFVARSRTNRVVLFGRAFLENNDPEPAVARIKAGLKITPYTPGSLGTSIASFLDGKSPLGRPAKWGTPRFVEGTGLAVNTCPPSDPDAFYRLLDEAVQAEPASALDPEVAAPIAAIGIVKDRPFSPDQRMAAILAEAGAAANACVRAVAMRPRPAEGFHFYPDTDSNWTSPLFAGGHSFQTPPPLVTEEGIQPFPDPGAKKTLARASFFYLATVITPAMCMNLPGIGSQYLGVTMDSDQQTLHGWSTYRLRLPAGIPAGKFWSLTAYDNQTRSMVVTDQRFPRAGSQAYPTPAAVPDADGSTTLWFGPVRPDKVPAGNWIQTDPQRAWFAILRFYNPLPAFFDKSWRPGEIELVDGS